MTMSLNILVDVWKTIDLKVQNWLLAHACIYYEKLDHIPSSCIVLMVHMVHVRARPSSLWVGLACRGCVGGNSLFVAFIDSESVVIAIQHLWWLLTPTVSIDIASAIILFTDQVFLVWETCRVGAGPWDYTNGTSEGPWHAAWMTVAMAIVAIGHLTTIIIIVIIMQDWM